MEHKESHNLIKVEFTVDQFADIIIQLDYLRKSSKEYGSDASVERYSDYIEPFKKALNYTLTEDTRLFSMYECKALSFANSFINDPDSVKRLDKVLSHFFSANDTEENK